VLELDLKSYEGGDPELTGLRSSLKGLENEVLSVILHGSCGDGRTTGYSDVDALVILRNEVFLDPGKLVYVAKRLTAACRFMYRFDPLQHHGWFAMAEQDLQCFPEELLPLESLREASVLFGQRRFRIRYPDSSRELFLLKAQRLSSKIEEQLLDGWRPSNLYQLKSLLSEFMMLPLLMVQAREGKGSSKRESFVTARPYFDPVVWSVMDDVSAIREKWKYSPGLLASLVLRRPGSVYQKIRKRWPTRIPSSLRQRVDETFYQRMADFATGCRQQLSVMK